MNAIIRTNIKLLGVIFISMSASTGTYAESVAIPVGQQGYGQAIQRPVSGITKNQVKAKFGEPNSWRSSVGQPPISSWVYPNFTVYFEYDRVIHTVINR